MRSSAVLLSAVFALAAVLPGTSMAAEKPSLSDLVLGKQLAGEKWTVDSLKGKTVLAYFWNIT